jgi:hypothetical protein
VALRRAFSAGAFGESIFLGRCPRLELIARLWRCGRNRVWERGTQSSAAGDRRRYTKRAHRAARLQRALKARNQFEPGASPQVLEFISGSALKARITGRAIGPTRDVETRFQRWRFGRSIFLGRCLRLELRARLRRLDYIEKEGVGASVGRVAQPIRNARPPRNAINGLKFMRPTLRLAPWRSLRPRPADRSAADRRDRRSRGRARNGSPESSSCPAARWR